MDGILHKSPQLGCPADSTEAKYISGLSTILVATIQEAKDRISQIEYIFCSQIYPNFQSKSKSLQKFYSEAREAAEAAWKEKERDLTLQIDKLQSEKQQFLDELHSLKLEREKFANMGVLSPDSICYLQEELSQKTKEVEERRVAQENLSGVLATKNSLIVDNEKLLKELEEKNNQLLQRQKYLEVEVESLKWELATKSKEIDEGMELQNKILELVQSKTSLVADQEKQLKDHEEKATLLLSRLEIMNKKFDDLQQEVREKTEEVAKARKLQENLLKKIESQSAEIMEHEQLLSKYDKEKILLKTRLEELENGIDLVQKEIGEKNIELEEGRKLQEELLQQINIYNMERLKTGQEFEQLEKEKQQVLAKLKISEEKVDKLQVNLKEASKESSEGMELHGKLLQQIEAKDSELMSEKRKRKDAVTAYKKLKSQFNFLCAKFGLAPETMLLQNKVEDENELLRHNLSVAVEDDSKVPNGSDSACQENKWKDQRVTVEDYKGVRPIQRSSSVSPSTSRTFIEPKSVAKVKSCPPAGTKRPVSYWRDTRSHQSRLYPDPHDDFLDTPLEKVKGDLGKAMNDEAHNLPEPAQKDIDFDNSDDETQDVNVVDLGSQKQPMPPSRRGTLNYKYIEPVRKKAEREKLKGIECKQCKKFYDAVLPDEGKETNSNKHNLRCEHHDGISRHRYRYAPPLTPEGFWNIGFDSEM